MREPLDQRAQSETNILAIEILAPASGFSAVTCMPCGPDRLEPPLRQILFTHNVERNQHLAGPSIHVTGRVDDIRPFVQKAPV